MAVERTATFFAVLLLAGALQISTVSAASASLSTQTGASSNSVDGFASASSNLKITSGEGSAIAFASSEAYTTARSEIVTNIQRIINKLPPLPSPLDLGAYCPEVAEFIEIEAQAIGIAGARVTVDVVSDVIIDGQGSGCSSADASGEAFAVAFAELFVDAIVTTGINGIDEATAKAVLRAKSDAFAAAFAQATSSACLNGPGSAIAEESVEAIALAKPIASILVFLEAFVDCSGFADSFVEAEAGALLNEIVTEVSSNSFTEAVGDANADTTAAAGAFTGRVCSGIFDNCCKRTQGRRLGEGGICHCTTFNRSNGAKCKATKMITAGKVFFDDEFSGDSCACP